MRIEIKVLYLFHMFFLQRVYNLNSMHINELKTIFRLRIGELKGETQTIETSNIKSVTKD